MTECSAILFHVTKKKYLEDILRDGLVPGEEEGLLACAVTEGWGSSLLDHGERELCSEYVFLSGNIETIEALISTRPEFDIILLLCLPIDRVTVGTWKNFKEYREYTIKDYLKYHPEIKKEDIYYTTDGYTYLNQLFEIRTKGRVDPIYIIGYLEIKRRTKDTNDWTYELITI